MVLTATKSSKRMAANDGTSLQIGRLGNESGGSGTTQSRLQQLAREVMSEISKLDPSCSKELLGVFVSELFLLVAEQGCREVRRQRQAEGIAAAKAKGVHFGP